MKWKNIVIDIAGVAALLASLAVLLWDHNSVDGLKNAFSEMMSQGKAQFFLKYENDLPAGYAPADEFDITRGGSHIDHLQMAFNSWI